METETATKLRTKVKTTVEQQASVGFKVATALLMGSGLLAFTLLATIWSMKA